MLLTSPLTKLQVSSAAIRDVRSNVYVPVLSGVGDDCDHQPSPDIAVLSTATQVALAEAVTLPVEQQHIAAAAFVLSGVGNDCDHQPSPDTAAPAAATQVAQHIAAAAIDGILVCLGGQDFNKPMTHEQYSSGGIDCDQLLEPEWSGSGSDNSDGPISRGARRAAIAAAQHALSIPAPEFDFPAWKIPTPVAIVATSLKKNVSGMVCTISFIASTVINTYSFVVNRPYHLYHVQVVSSVCPVVIDCQGLPVLGSVSDGPVSHSARRRRIIIDDSDSAAPSPVPAVALNDPHPHVAPDEPPNLWVAVPHRFDSRFLDLTAKHDSDMDAEASSTGESDGMLTPGFVSDQDDAVKGVVLDTEMQLMADLLPLTARRIRYARKPRR